MLSRALTLLLALLPAVACAQEEGPVRLRVAAFNLEDVRTEDLRDPDQPRLRQVGRILQRIRPDIVLLSEVAYDMAGAPGHREGEPEGLNGQRLADVFLAVSQGPGLEPLRYRAFMAPTNTGLASGHDLDNSGRVVEDFPPPPGSGPDGEPGRQTPAGRAYGGDCWGFGTFPGQYAFTLLVREDLELLTDEVRSYQTLRWIDLPDPRLPVDPETGEGWYSDDELEGFRLSSKTHMIVPVRLPNGAVLNLLCSHPTPPAFDGPEGRNKARNHDEIRLLGDLISGAEYLVDDQGRRGGLDPEAHFVILGDLNADPDEGASLDDPIGTYLLGNPRVNGEVRPLSDVERPRLDPDDTSGFRLRVDYALPSRTLEVLGCGMWRPPSDEGAPSDHFPVWVDVAVPAPE
jgi:endonuclease/exonuclease/phosphatase family metal-dependent hydrolase